MKYKFVLVASARWETDSIMEWVAYHRALGFEHIYLYCNDDDPVGLYEVLAPLLAARDPFVTFVHYPHQGMQGRMYKRFLANAAHEAEWACFLDIDEFLALKGAPSIEEFMAPYEPLCDVLYFNWAMFGPNGFHERPPGSVLLQYFRRETSLNAYTKIIFRPEALNLPLLIAEGETGFWHKLEPRFGKARLRQINVIGDLMDDYYSDFPKSCRAYLDQGDRQRRMLATAVIHHYAFRSANDLRRRLDRGIEGDFGGQGVFRDVVDGGDLRGFLTRFDEVEDRFLCGIWSRFLDRAWQTNALSRPRGPNIALGKPASQSSVSQWSREPSAERDAARVVSGRLSGWYNCHTDLEDGPWWQVDLGASQHIREVRIFNRAGPPEIMARTSHLALLLSDDERTWHEALVKRDDGLVGGIDEGPLIWVAEGTVSARFVRVQLLGRNYLHLDQVEVYGDP